MMLERTRKEHALCTHLNVAEFDTAAVQTGTVDADRVRHLLVHRAHHSERRALVIGGIADRADLLVVRGVLDGRGDDVLGAGAEAEGVAGPAVSEEAVQAVGDRVGGLGILAVDAGDGVRGVTGMSGGRQGQSLCDAVVGGRKNFSESGFTCAAMTEGYQVVVEEKKIRVKVYKRSEMCVTLGALGGSLKGRGRGR